MNYQTVGYLERGEYNPSLDLALRAAEYSGLPVEAIFSRRPFTPMSEQLYAGAARTVGGGCAAGDEHGLPGLRTLHGVMSSNGNALPSFGKQPQGRSQ